MDKIYIVMDFIKHDLKALMSTMKEKFLESTNFEKLCIAIPKNISEVSFYVQMYPPPPCR